MWNLVFFGNVDQFFLTSRLTIGGGGGGGGGATTKKIMPQGKSQDVLCLFVVAHPPHLVTYNLVLYKFRFQTVSRRFASILPSHVLIAKFLTIKLSILISLLP